MRPDAFLCSFFNLNTNFTGEKEHKVVSQFKAYKESVLCIVIYVKKNICFTAVILVANAARQGNVRVGAEYRTQI